MGRQCMNFLVAKEESLVEFYDRYSINIWWDDEDIKFNKSQIKKAVKKYAEDTKGKDQFLTFKTQKILIPTSNFRD